MTLSTTATENVVKQWDSDFYREYIRANRFSRYQGTDSNSIIQLKEQLTKKPGDAITLSLVKALSGAGVTGNTLLEGAEESLRATVCPSPVKAVPSLSLQNIVGGHAHSDRDHPPRATSGMSP